MVVVCLLRGGVCSRGGGSALGGFVWSGGVGVSAPRGGGVCLVQGGSAPGGLPGLGGVSQHALRQIPSPL